MEHPQARSPGDSFVHLRPGLCGRQHWRAEGVLPAPPNDAWDFSGNNEIVLFDYKDPKTGKTIKAGAHADRNGFFYVTDRTQLANGAGYPNKPTALLNAFPFVEGITWAKAST